MAYETKTEQLNVFEVVYSPFDFAEKGDHIAIYQDTDYPISFKDLVCIKEQFCIKNITKDNPLNDYVEVKPLSKEGYSKEGGVLISNKDLNKGWGLLGHKQVYHSLNSSLSLPNGNQMVSKDEIYITR